MQNIEETQFTEEVFTIGDKIVIDGEINPVNANSFIKQLHEFSNNPDVSIIQVDLTTPGGDVTEMFRMLNAMQRCSKEVHVYANGLVASAGVWLLMAGKKRYAYEHTFFYLHDMIVTAEGHFSAFNSQVRYINKLQDYLYNMLENKTKLTKPEAIKLCNSDEYFNVQEALNYGIIEKIV